MKRICVLILSFALILSMTTTSFASGEAGVINSSTYGNTYVVKDDGSLWGWGGDYVGTGDSQEHLTPAKILDNVRSISAGGWSTYVAVKKDDTLWGWGNFDGYPAEDYNPTYLTPIKLNIEDVKTAAAGQNFVLVLKNDNTLWLCGDMVLGDGTTTKADSSEGFVKINENISFIAASAHSVFYIDEDHNLWGFGENNNAELGNMSTEGDGLTNTSIVHTPFKILEDVKYVSADIDGGTLFAVKLDNSLYAWGEAGFYTEDFGWIEDAGKPYKVMDDVKSAVASSDIGFVVKTDNTLWGWGYDYETGNTTYEKSLHKILDNVKSVTVGERHASIVKTDNTLWTMGGNYRGGLGHEGDETWYTPLKKILSNIQDAPDSWATAEVDLAIGEKLIPEDMQSNYTKPITREEFCILAIRMIEVRSNMTIDEYLAAAGRELAPADTFVDCDTKEVLAAKALGITDGTSPTTFEPDNLLTREQAAKFLSTTAIACGKDVELSSPSYADLDEIAGWAQPYTGYVYNIGVMKGVGANKFSPRASYQRQQAFMTMYRIWQAIESVNPENIGASEDAPVFSMKDYDKKIKYTKDEVIKTVLNSLDYSVSEETRNIKLTYQEVSEEKEEDVTVLYRDGHMREERPQGLNGDTTTIYNALKNATYGLVKPGNYTDYHEGNLLFMYRLNKSILDDIKADPTVLDLQVEIYLGICSMTIKRNDLTTEKYAYSVDSGIPLSYIKMIYNESGDFIGQVDWEAFVIDSTVISPEALFEIPENAKD